MSTGCLITNILLTILYLFRIYTSYLITNYKAFSSIYTVLMPNERYAHIVRLVIFDSLHQKLQDLLICDGVKKTLLFFESLRYNSFSPQHPKNKAKTILCKQFLLRLALITSSKGNWFLFFATGFPMHAHYSIISACAWF